MASNEMQALRHANAGLKSKKTGSFDPVSQVSPLP